MSLASIKPVFELRDYQTECVQKVMNDLGEHGKVGIIAPTGAGKTEIFVAIAERFLALNPDKSVLVLSHLSLLTTQTFQRFLKRAPQLEVGIFQANQTPDREVKVVIGTMQTSRNAEKSDDLNLMSRYKIGLVIIDEAHYLSCPSYDLALSYFPDAKQVGCTATPFRAGALMTNYFDKISFSISLHTLISKGHLVPPKLLQFVVEGDDTERMALVAKLYTAHERGKKALIFMQSVEGAKQMRNVLETDGVRTRVVTREQVGEYRDGILDDFRAGKIDVLVTVNVLTAGVDLPNVEAIFMPYATKSPVTYLQRVGRGLRQCPEIGKKECRIYVCGDAPSIQKDVYQKVHDLALLNPRKKKTTTFSEDLEYNFADEEDLSTEIYKWTSEVVKAVERMKLIGMERLATILNEKKFPQRYLKDIALFADSLPDRPIAYGTEPATAAQVKALKNFGFTKDSYKELSKGEASMMIATAHRVKDGWRRSPFILPSGNYAGRHVSETSFVYRRLVMSQMPQSEVAQIIREWITVGEPRARAKAKA